MKTISRGDILVKGFTDNEMDFQLIRQLGSSLYKGASVGECLNIANQIADNNPKQWVEHFARLAEWQKSDGLERLIRDHVISGREQLLKASNSFRAAEYYSPCNTKKKNSYGLNAADCFFTAISNMDLHCENHSIAYKNILIPSYFISPANDGMKRPTLLIVGGFDSTLEEEFILRGLAAVERGYNVIHFAGPGQMDVFRKYPKAFFEPDYEYVVKKVIHHFEYRHEVDMHRLYLMGISLGGYFATQAACYDNRIKALIANSPILDLYNYLRSFVPHDPCELSDTEDFDVEALAQITDAEMSTQLKVQTEHLITRFGQKTFKNTFEYLKSFYIDQSMLHLDIPCLALIGAAEGKEPKAQYEEFCTLTKADSYEFSAFEGASSHCQIGNVSYANAVVYDWLDSL